MKNKLQVLIPIDCISVCNIIKKLNYKDNKYSSTFGFFIDVIMDTIMEDSFCILNSVNFSRKDINDNDYWIIEFEIKFLPDLKNIDYEYKKISYRNKIQQTIIDVLTNAK